jgi:hypothetical protein
MVKKRSKSGQDTSRLTFGKSTDCELCLNVTTFQRGCRLSQLQEVDDGSMAKIDNIAGKASDIATLDDGGRTKSGPSSSSIGTALSTGRNLVLLQLLSRVLTFVLNQGLVRLAPPEVFGTAAIQFDLIYSTILFLSREGIRNALLRSTHSGTTSGSLARLPLKIGFGVAAAVVGLYLYSSDGRTTNQPGFYVALGLYVVSALLELGVEPMYIATLRSEPPRLGVRMQAEGGMAIIKALVTFGSLVVAPKHALLGFALGQVVGDAWLAGRYTLEWGPGPAVKGYVDCHAAHLEEVDS